MNLVVPSRLVAYATRLAALSVTIGDVLYVDKLGINLFSIGADTGKEMRHTIIKR